MAQSLFALSIHCEWCHNGTPLMLQKCTNTDTYNGDLFLLAALRIKGIGDAMLYVVSAPLQSASARLSSDRFAGAARRPNFLLRPMPEEKIHRFFYRHL